MHIELNENVRINQSPLTSAADVTTKRQRSTACAVMHKVHTASVISAESPRVNFHRWSDARLMATIVHPALTSGLGDAMARRWLCCRCVRCRCGTVHDGQQKHAASTRARCMLDARGEHEDVAAHQRIFAIDRQKRDVAVHDVNRHPIVGGVGGKISTWRERHECQSQRPVLDERPRAASALREQFGVDRECVLIQVLDKDLT